MKIFKGRINIMVVLLTGSLMLSACSLETVERENQLVETENQFVETGLTQSESFDIFLDDLAMEALKASPLAATFTLGDLEEAGLLYLAEDLDRIDLAAHDESLVQAKADLETLRSFDPEQLTDQQKLNYELVKFNLQHALKNDFTYIENLIQPSAGVQVNIPLTLMQIEFESVHELDAFMLRVKKLPRLFDDVIAYEQERFALGYGLPAYLYKDVVDQIDAMLVEPEAFMMYLSFSDKVDVMDDLNDEEKADYKERYLTIVKDDLYPAFGRLKAQAQAMEISENSGSISEWADGQAYYQELVDYMTSGELDVEGLEEWANSLLAQTTNEFQSLLTSYPDLMTMDIESLLPKYDSMEQVYDLVYKIYHKEFMDYGIELASEHVIPKYLEEYLPSGFYFPVTTDGQDYGNMFLQASTYDNISVDTVWLYYHENIPGHHLYYSYIANSQQPLYRKMNEYLPYEEGWATYLETACFKYMDLPEGLAEYYELNSQYSNALMVLLDINFHYKGMTADEIKGQLLMMGYDDESATSLINRIISKPGEMIHYMYGDYKMNEFKNIYKKAAGDHYSDKDFHEFILSHYGLPFYLVEDELAKLTFY